MFEINKNYKLMVFSVFSYTEIYSGIQNRPAVLFLFYFMHFSYYIIFFILCYVFNISLHLSLSHFFHFINAIL